MRQITFELLRHGQPHNQLLSPLTQYLALCENHAAVTLQLPFEHNQFLHRLRALSYQMGGESRAFQVKDTARELGALLAQVPGLIAELNREQRAADPPGSDNAGSRSRQEPQRLTHLRVVISASELALLPFELALSPNGFPGAGQPLLLQSQEPMCLTREVRRVPDRRIAWPRHPRILFVAAAPADVDPIPMESHLAVLRRLLEPWLRHAETDEERRRELEKHLVVLPEASCQAIERAIAEGRFSHVHFLAHGVQYPDGYDTRFGLALHDPMDPKGKADIVSGERLATILRAVETPGEGELARPLAVTLASCDSGNQGTVAGMGASLAHALHAAGVPIVVASQFPMSVAASVQFVEVLYSSLLWGEDPRVALNDLRRRLHSRFPTTHDWASLTAYVSLPVDFERSLSDVQIDQTMRSIDVSLNYADRATSKLMPPKSGRAPADTKLGDEQKTKLLQDAGDRIEAGKQRLERLLGRSRDRKARVLGLLAATEKRCAEVYFAFGRVVSRRNQEKDKWLPLLQKARQHYWDAFLLDRHSSWAVVQYLSLDLLLRRLKEPGKGPTIEGHEEYNRPGPLWNLAHVNSINELRSQDEQRIRWAYGNLIELYLIALLPEAEAVASPKQGDWVQCAEQRAQDLLDRAGAEAFEVYSTRRQILRYDDWYQEIANIAELSPAVERLLGAMPIPTEGTA